MADTLLLVDDDASVLRAIGDYFERLGYEVVREATGDAGVETFTRVRPDVVILDLNLPDASGLVVLERLRRENGAVILLTGQGDIETAVRAMQLGAENFLTKPVDMVHLAAATARVVEKVRLSRQNCYARATTKARGSGRSASHRRCARWRARWSCWRRASGPRSCSRARAAPARGGWRA